MATVEQAEHLEQRVLADVSRAATRVSMRMGANGLRACLGVLRDAALRLQTGGPERGEVSIQAFSKVSSERDVVGLEAREITREVRRELSRHGVLFAIEKGVDGQAWVHVQAKDAKLIAHAMERAEESVDRRIARQQARAEAAQGIKERVAGIRQERSEKRERTQEQKHGRTNGTLEVEVPEEAHRPSRTR